MHGIIGDDSQSMRLAESFLSSHRLKAQIKAGDVSGKKEPQNIKRKEACPIKDAGWVTSSPLGVMIFYIFPPGMRWFY